MRWLQPTNSRDNAVFITGHAHVLCLERVVKCQSTETQSRHRVEAESELSRDG